MAKVILGGLLTSTILNIYIVPIVYSILSNRGIIKTVKK
jgi:Cu(I)/Ag(I) efflux system membrane protein CusA/SilA